MGVITSKPYMREPLKAFAWICKIAAVVIDGDFIDFTFAFQDLGGDFGLEIEPVRTQLDRADDVAFKGFIAGFHVGEVDVGEAIGKQGEGTVADRVPEI